MKPEEILFNAMMPHLTGAQSDILMACGGLILLTIVVVCFFVLRNALFVDHHARDKDEADRCHGVYTREDASPYEREVARKKFNRITSRGSHR